jgi:hypothetical protein
MTAAVAAMKIRTNKTAVTVSPAFELGVLNIEVGFPTTSESGAEDSRSSCVTISMIFSGEVVEDVNSVMISISGAEVVEDSVMTSGAEVAEDSRSVIRSDPEAV